MIDIKDLPNSYQEDIKKSSKDTKKKMVQQKYLYLVLL